MKLDKGDLKAIETIVDKSVDQIVTKRVDQIVIKRVTSIVDKAVDTLAGISKREFDANTESHVKLFRGQQEIKESIDDLNFKATETVARAEFFQLKQKVNKIGTKMGIR